MSDTNLLIRKRKRVREGLIELAIRLSSLIAIISLLLIFIFIGKEAIPILTSGEIQEEVSIKSLFFPLSPESPFVWQPISRVPKYSILPLFIGTLKVTVVSLLIAIPIALGAALFTAEFAPVWLREILKPVVELLAGIPSVVVGFFALMVMATWFQNIFGFTFRLNAITAGMGLALAVIPIIYTVAEDAFLAVPENYREGSFALGATTWQTAWRVVLPAALPGAFAACVLGFGRAIGETMIVLMASGNSATLSLDPTLSFRSFSASIAAELAEVVVGSAHYHVLFFLGAFLFIMTFFTNLAGHWYVQRLQKKLSGA
jgi:phosphate transport system permease protein